MASFPCVRVCLHFPDFDDETCWFLVDFKKMPTIECMQSAISRKFYDGEETLFKLTLKGSLLPAWESSCILRDDDQIVVEHKSASHHSCCKKRKRRKKNCSKSYFFYTTKHKSLGATETKNTRNLVNNGESILTIEAPLNNMAIPDIEMEEEKSYKKKKKTKLDCTSELPIMTEEKQPPSKKTKISRSTKTEHRCKKKTVNQEMKTDVVKVTKDYENIVSLPPEDNKNEDITICNNSDDSHQNLKKNEVEITKVEDNVPVNSDTTIPVEISDPPHKSDISTGISVPKDTSCYIEEKVEVYTIAKKDLESIWESLMVGETLTIDQDKVKAIDIDNSSNSLDCMDARDSLIKEEVKKPEMSTTKESKKCSGNNMRRRRRRKGQRSFACSPFISVMNQSLDSNADNRSSISTPVASQPKKGSSSNTGSQKHFYFDSDNEEDNDVEADDDEKDILELKEIEAENSKNNLQNSKSSLSSDKNDSNGSKDTKSSFIQQEEKEDKKHPSERSVHFSLENVLSESFDSSQGPIVYKRGHNANQRRNYPTLIRQQQLNTSLESCSSICTSVEDNSDLKSANNTATKSTKDYSLLPGIVGYPRAGDKIAFKRLEIGEDYSPRLSDFIVARVISFQEDTKMLEMKILSATKNCRKEDKFEVVFKNDNDIMILEAPEDAIECVELWTLQDMKLVK